MEAIKRKRSGVGGHFDALSRRSREIGEGEAKASGQEDLIQLAWDEFEHEERPDFFKAVEIAPDGGFSEVRDLWYPTRSLTALLTLFFAVSNIIFILSVDFQILRGTLKIFDDDKFLLTQILYRNSANFVASYLAYDSDLEADGDKCIAALEMIGALILLLNLVVQAIRACSSLGERQRWFAIEKILWGIVPELSSYSAMRLLSKVSPTLFIVEATQHWALNAKLWKEQKVEVLRSWAVFVFVHCFCFVLGFDAFIVKCRAASSFLNRKSLSLRIFWESLTFLVQVIGVVQVGTFVKARLFVFIFAGEDSTMQPREVALQRAWNGLLVREIWRKHSFFRFLVIMLSFNDADFQRLVLNESSSEKELEERYGAYAKSKAQSTVALLENGAGFEFNP
jgi:hypothetical protein